MKSVGNIRVIPVVLVAIFGFTVLKVAGLVLNGAYIFDYHTDAPKKSWAQANLNFPTGRIDPDITGAVHENTKEGSKEEAPKPDAPESKPNGIVLHPEENQQPVSASERAILERLQSRRQELDARAREIDIRESLLKATEKRIDSKVEELKAVESRISAAKEQKAEAENARFKGLVTTYESMKPKDAAKVFDRLEMSVLIEIASQIAPRKMSDIMGLMQPEAAERLTVELARRANGDRAAASEELPKIEGKVIPTQRVN